MASKLTLEQKNVVRMWIHQVHADLVACYISTKNDPRGMKFKDSWSKIDFNKRNEAKYEELLENGWYDDGFGIRCGEILRGEYKGKNITLFDFDTKEAFDRFCKLLGVSIEQLAKWTRVEWHGDPESIHFFVITNTPFNHIDIDGFQIHSTHQKLAFVAPSIYPGGEPYRVYEDINESIAILDDIDKRRLETIVEVFVKKYTADKKSYFNNNQLKEHLNWLDNPNTILGPGGRYPNTWIKACSIFFKWKDPEFKELSDDQRYQKLLEWHNLHCSPSLFKTPGREKDVENIWKEVCRVNTGKRQQERDERAEAEEKAKADAMKCTPNMVKKKLDIFASIQEGIRKTLVENIWTRVSEDPPKFVVARKKEGDICKAQIYSRNVTVGWNNAEPQKQLVHNLEYGTTVFKVFPLQVTLHESPLKFLEAPPSYTIIFEDQSNKRFTLTGSIEKIVQRLKEMPGCVISSYAVCETLTAIIGAFADDGNLIIDKSVEFEGYYFADDDIHISKIDFDIKHPVRTREECVECADYLEERIKFQTWRHNNKLVDRRDVYATALRWTAGAPYNFAIKQLSPPNIKRYHKAFDMTGERDGGKTGLSQEMLSMHGNGAGQKNVDSIYSVPAGSASTEAKFGKIMSRTTYPVEISEIGRIESYGRNESLVETYKNALESIKVRDGRKDDRYDAPFPACSPLILNGNPFISRKGELLKRLHVIKYSQEDRHDRNPNSPFNTFQTKNAHKLKIFGDWTMRCIWEHRQELILSREYDGYQIGNWATHKFYEFIGREVPDWLNLWITDTSLEELDIDEVSLIRSILNDHVNKTIANKGIDPKTIFHLNDRIEQCLARNYWSWIRRGKKTILNGKDEKGRWITRKDESENYYIDTGILELFRERLPDISFKKLAEKIGMEVSTDHKGRYVMKCTKKEFQNFITGDIVIEDIKVGADDSVLEGESK